LKKLVPVGALFVVLFTVIGLVLCAMMDLEVMAGQGD
jgi:hypothetical protein